MSLSPRLIRIVLFGSALLLTSAPLRVEAQPEAAESAEAESAKPPRVALAVSGPKSKQIRGWLVKELKDEDIELVAEKKVRGVKAGQDAEKYAETAKKNDLSAIVVAQVEKKGKAWTLELEVRNGADGAVLGTLTIEGKSQNDLKKKIGDELSGGVSGPLERAKSAAEAEAEAEAEKAKAEAEAKAKAAEEEAEAAEAAPEPAVELEAESEEADDSELRSALEVNVGVKGISRDFDYRDNVSGLETYSLGKFPGLGAPAPFINLRFYPLAFSQTGFLANIGLIAGYEKPLGISSETVDGAVLDSSSSEYYAGLRVRLPVDRHEFGINVAYGAHDFEIQQDESVPDVKYTFVRALVDGRFRFGKVLLGAQLGPRILLGSGQLEDIFPDSTGGGFELGLQAGYAVTSTLDVVAGFDLRRYYFTLNPSTTPGSAPQINGELAAAGGAVDQYMGLSLGVTWRNRE